MYKDISGLAIKNGMLIIHVDIISLKSERREWPAVSFVLGYE